MTKNSTKSLVSKPVPENIHLCYYIIVLIAEVLPLLEVENTFVALVIIAASNFISYFCRQRLASLTPNSNIDLLVATSWSNIAPVQRLQRQNIGGIFGYSFVLYMHVPYLTRHRMIEYSTATHYIHLKHPVHQIHTSER